MNIVITIVVCFSLFFQQGQIHLAADLKKDKKICAQNHGVYTYPDKKIRWSEFEYYSRFNLSKYSFTKTKYGKHTISRWSNPISDATLIFQVETSIPVDTLIKSINGTDKDLHIKTNFYFHTYVLRSKGYPDLIYLTERNEGLSTYSIGGKKQFVVHESIPIGYRQPNIDEIVRIVDEMK